MSFYLLTSHGMHYLLFQKGEDYNVLLNANSFKEIATEMKTVARINLKSSRKNFLLSYEGDKAQDALEALLNGKKETSNQKLNTSQEEIQTIREKGCWDVILHNSQLKHAQ